MPGGDILEVQQRSERPFSIDYQVDGSDTSSSKVTLLTARSPFHTIYVQKITYAITSHAAKTVQLEDSANTPVPIFTHTDAAAGAGVPSVVPADFGPHGTALTAGKNLVFTGNASGSGSKGRLHVEGYEKLSSVVNTGTANTSN